METAKPLKVYLEQQSDHSSAVFRVVKAFHDYSPKHIQIVDHELDADLVIMHVVGRHDAIEKRAQFLKSKGIDYAIIQYCLKSTQRPDPKDWYWLWNDAQLVWSYYNLHDHIKPHFYYAPLGVDKNIFKVLEGVGQDYLICTTGRGYLTESVRECIKAAKAVGGTIAHLGKDLGIEGIDYYNGLTDPEVAGLFNRCRYVSGLRRDEGFELPGIEGFYCGARPIYFDQPHYKEWFDGIAEFIPEVGRDQIVEDLITLFQSDMPMVVQGEIDKRKDDFDWQKIIEGFWLRI